MKTVIVTGANRGIGYQICKDLGQKDFKVILTARDKDKGLKATQGLNKLGLDVQFYQLDVGSEQSIDAFSKEIARDFDSIDVLINNAGIHRSGSVINAKASDIKETMDINFVGPWMLTNALLPLFQKSKNPRIINISSGAGEFDLGYRSYASYAISKYAMNGWTRMLADNLSSSNIKVNAMCPGWVRSDMGGSAAPLSLEEGADTANWLATMDNPPHGKFFRARKEINW